MSGFSAEFERKVERVTAGRKVLERIALTAALNPHVRAVDASGGNVGAAMQEALENEMRQVSLSDAALIREWATTTRGVIASEPEAKDTPSVVWTRPRANRLPHAFIGPEPERGAWLSACGVATMPTGAMLAGHPGDEHEHCAACARAVEAL